jgi:uncharacterized membrane protein YvlD (DUF360 family)
MLQWLISLLVIALCVRLFAAVIPGVDVDGHAPAIGAACAVVVMGYLIGLVRVPLPIPDTVAAIGFACVANVLGVGLAAALLPGIRVKAMSSVLCLGVLLTFATVAISYGWSVAATAGVLSAAG